MTTGRYCASSVRRRQTDRVKAGLRPPLETSKRGERDVLVDALTGNIAWSPPGESARHRIDATRLAHSHACGQHLRHRKDHYQIRRPLLDLQERSGLDTVQASNPIRWHQQECGAGISTPPERWSRATSAGSGWASRCL